MSNSDWWAQKLGNQPSAPNRAPLSAPISAPSQMPMAPMPVFQQSQQAPTKAQSANQTATCPDCGSGNYFSATPQTQQRCYDCGYPVQQSGSRYGSLTGANVQGAAKPAMGNDATNNYNPTVIIGKVG